MMMRPPIHHVLFSSTRRRSRVLSERISQRVGIEGIDPLCLYGHNDANLVAFEKRYGVNLVARGQSIVVACRGGLGRTGTAVGCLLRDGGLSGPEAVRLTRDSRRDTIERDTQVAFVESWEPSPG